MNSPPAAETLTDAEYERRARQTLAAVEATVDRLLEDDIVDIDASRTGGLLELAFPAGGRIVINTQPPLQELWLASPAGGWHFKSVAGRWIEAREGREFFAELSQCATQQAGLEVRFEAP